METITIARKPEYKIIFTIISCCAEPTKPEPAMCVAELVPQAAAKTREN